MGTITFKNVGQGDSIILEWEKDGKNYLGIIDCNLYDNKNPIVDYLSIKAPTEIEFIVLSHFHYDHFSGMPELFKFCIDRGIKIKWFFHTLTFCILQVYDKISKSKKVEKAASDFFHYYELLLNNISNDLEANFHTAPINLSDSLTMKFLGPSEKIGKTIATLINKKISNQKFSINDINKFSTLIYLYNNDNSILLTSDSPKANYKRLSEKIIKEVGTVQVPHHGSVSNLLPDFWKKIPKKEHCFAVFSVGNEPKDKLPDLATVEFFHQEGFDVYSTNAVFGINEYFNLNRTSENQQCDKKALYLNHFSSKVNTVDRKLNDLPKFNGDQKFEF